MWSEQLHNTSAAYEGEMAAVSPRRKEQPSPSKNVDVSSLLDESEFTGSGWNKPGNLKEIKKRFLLQMKDNSDVSMTN